jgi:hypothetical protein
MNKFDATKTTPKWTRENGGRISYWQLVDGMTGWRVERWAGDRQASVSVYRIGDDYVPGVRLGTFEDLKTARAVVNAIVRARVA